MSEPVSEAGGTVGFVDVANLEALWADAPTEEDGALLPLLRAAYEACVAYLPPETVAGLLTGSVRPTESMVLAQILHTQHLWARNKAGNGAGYGADGYMVQTYPLVMEARSLLRPKRGPFQGLR